MALYKTGMKNPIYHMLNTKYLSLILLFLLAFGERVFFDLGPNIELITMAMILTAYYFGKKESFWLTFAVIAFSDVVIGNSNIFLFTWSGFLIPALLSSRLITLFKLISQRLTNLWSGLKLIPLISVGLFSNLFFYLWTNFGVWLLDSWGMYPDTFQGLLLSYINALPFLRLQIASTLIFLPLVFISIELMVFLNSKFHLENKSDNVFGSMLKIAG